MRALRLWLMESGVKTNGLTGWLSLALGLYLLLGSPRFVQGQNVCANPRFPGDFSVDKAKICVGSSVNIVGVPANLISAQYNFEYDGKSTIDKVTLAPTKAHTYSTPGSYTIIQSGTGNGAGTGTIFCKEVVVLPVDQVKFTVNVCSGRRAILVPDGSTLGQYDSYEIRWGDGTVERKTRAELTNQPAHTYSNSGNTVYTIALQGVYNPPADCKSTVSQSTPISLIGAATQPTISALKTTSDNTIDIDYQANTGIAVQLYQKVNGAYVSTGKTSTGGGTFTVQTDAKQVQCFQVVTQDACNSTPVKSDEVCSLVLDAKAANKQNNLSWQAYAGTATQFRFYRIRRNGVVNGQLTSRTTTTYTDANDITCGTQYCYSLEATVGPTTITSQQVCVNGINDGTPGDIEGVVVSIENNRPRIVANLPAASLSSTFTLVVSRASGSSGTYQQVGTLVNQNSFVDESADPAAGSYCYQLSYQSACGLSSKPSEPVCSVFLNSNSPKGIDWSASSPFTPSTVAEYIVEVIDSVNNTKREIRVSSNTHLDLTDADLESQTQKYRIITASSDGTVSYSNFYTFRSEVKIWLPDAFTPDGDGMNEVFLAKGIYLDQFRMTIFDRWGEVVFTTTDKQQGWDGTVNGQRALEGQYLYRIEVIDQTNLKTVRTGGVLLVRSKR
ncbi:gliding motility-associated C-terminal domain-containing protein [Spirosoma sp.]|uniref:gliding motility-associated C-terminal domain-containing protein n=1 Tax=Spirosoma sp. TaxID=1899569 RepID=UPI0025E2D89C|nr:gliding motility-associated C-terminal domain-containing protein [Spirosoma sp.]